jgi:predicted cupin superfamily sugar epimerase
MKCKEYAELLKNKGLNIHMSFEGNVFYFSLGENVGKCAYKEGFYYLNVVHKTDSNIKRTYYSYTCVVNPTFDMALKTLNKKKVLANKHVKVAKE